MTTHRPSWLQLVFLLAPFCGAQIQTAHVSPQKGETHHHLGAKLSLENILDRLDVSKTRTVEPGSWEEEVLKGDIKAAAKATNMNLAARDAPTVYTLAADDGDVLVARWKNAVDASLPVGTIWVWDTPTATVFITEIDESVLRPTNLPDYCERLWVWQGPIGLKSLRLSYLDQTVGNERVVG